MRYAMYVVGGMRCVWCQRPISFAEMQVEHLLPRSLTGEELSEALALHGLPDDYDIESLDNLASSCGECNRSKSDRVPPNVPIIAELLDKARQNAPLIEQRSLLGIKRRDLSAAIAKIEIAMAQQDDPEIEAMLTNLRTTLQQTQTDGGPDEEQITIEVHPALATLWNPDGRWKLTARLGPQTAVVSDGTISGMIGTDITYVCAFCGSNGPWSGTRCLTCGRQSEPWD